MPLLVSVFAIALMAGCGGGGDDGNDQQAELRLKDQAGAKAKQAADRVVQATPDKNIPGPKYYEAVCFRRGEQPGLEVPPNVIKCHIEAFYKPYRGKQGGYIWSEDWLVPIMSDGTLGTPVISGEYRIRNFLREDDKRNCVGRHRPSECLPESVGGELPG
jgi:hypothetical protein